MAWWTSQITQLGKIAGGMPPNRLKQLYNTVTVPTITYAANVWYTGIYKPLGRGKMRGSVFITNKLCTMQRRTAKFITGVLSTRARDAMDTHAYILPVDLLFHKILFCAATWIWSLPPTHPLAPHHTSQHQVKQHCSPLHLLFYNTKLRPDNIETISPIQCQPNYKPSFDIVIPESKDIALKKAVVINDDLPI